MHASQVHDSMRRLGDVQQSEQFLRGRVEELECSELNLKEALKVNDSSSSNRERRLKEQVSETHLP